VHTSANERRRNQRRKTFQCQEEVTVRLEGGAPTARPLAAKVKNVSESGLGLEAPFQLKVGAIVSITGVIVAGLSRRTLDAAPAKVASCTPLNEACYVIGLEFTQPGESSEQHCSTAAADGSAPDYYDILQLSPKADPDTIHRVYRMLAQRYHPDNLATGDQEQFRTLLQAYSVLNDPEKRAAYDATLTQTRRLRWKIFDQAAAAQGKQGEKHKRAGVLSLLYAKRLNETQQPAMTIHEFEDLLGCPKEHLDFSLWYLKEAGCITRTDSGRYAITMRGVDAVESDESKIRPKERLITAVK
jgi:curved DNA-binding protein